MGTVAKVESIDLSEATMTAVAKIENILKERDDKIANVGSELAKALTTARTIQAIRDAITPEMLKDVMALQGKKLGFRTDRDDKGGYAAEVVKDCAIEAMMRGVHLVGNEMNIIAGNFYATRESFQRKLREFPGLTDLDIEYGVPKAMNNRTTVTCIAKWRLNGTQMELTREIPIRVNAGMGDDAILGKADRKMRAAIYERLTGSVLSDGDVDDVDTITVPKHELPKGNVTGESLTRGKVSPEPSRDKPTLEQFIAQAKAAKSRPELEAMYRKARNSGALTDAQLEQLTKLCAERSEELVE